MRLKDTKQEKKWSVAMNELVLDDNRDDCDVLDLGYEEEQYEKIIKFVLFFVFG